MLFLLLLIIFLIIIFILLLLLCVDRWSTCRSKVDEPIRENCGMPQTVWPKVLAPLTSEQRHISDDFMKYWHEVLPKKYSVIDKFNHNYPVRASEEPFARTLEIGAGIGEHLHYEQLSPDQERGYHALELRENMAQRIRERFPNINVVTGDCQKRLDFDDGYF